MILIGAVAVTNGAFYQESLDSPLLSVSCDGSESYLTECQLSNILALDCQSRDAGIICQGRKYICFAARSDHTQKVNVHR